MKNKLIAAFFLIGASFLFPSYLWVRDYVIDKGSVVDSEVASQFASVIGAIVAFWSLGLNVVLVYIAYKAFENFDVKKQYHNSQLEVMSQLAREMAEFEFSVMFYWPSVDPLGKEHSVSEGWTFNFFSIISFEYRSDQVLYGQSRNMENFMPFLKYRSHPLVPRNIANILFEIYVPFHYMVGTTHDNAMDDYRAVFYSRTTDNELFKDSLHEISGNAAEYIANGRKLQASMKEWFEKYGADDVNL